MRVVGTVLALYAFAFGARADERGGSSGKQSNTNSIEYADPDIFSNFYPSGLCDPRKPSSSCTTRSLRGSNEIPKNVVEYAIRRMLAKKLPSDAYCYDPIEAVQSQQLFDASAALEFLNECEEAVPQAKKQCVSSAMDTFYQCVKFSYITLSASAHRCLLEKVYPELLRCIDDSVQKLLGYTEFRKSEEINDDLALPPDDDESVLKTA